MKKSREELLKEMYARAKPKYPDNPFGALKEYCDCYFDSQDYEGEKEQVAEWFQAWFKSESGQ